MKSLEDQLQQHQGFERVGCNKVGFGWLSGGSVDKPPVQLFEVLGLHLTLLTGNVFERVGCNKVGFGW